MKARSLVSIALALAFASGAAQAQGIPVIDAANLMQTIQQVTNDITKINNQVQQITQLRRHLESINGVRNLGTVFNNPTLRNYVPVEAFRVVNAVSASGYDGLTGTAKALRDAGMLYNCTDLASAPARTACQAALARPYQHKGLLQDAMRAAGGRLAQIDALMSQIDATMDQKAVQEIQARIGAENALLAHELSQVQMLQAMADSDERIAHSRDRERQYEMLRRTGRIANYLH
jgi:type IV secretion system protein VirB5